MPTGRISGNSSQYCIQYYGEKRSKRLWDIVAGLILDVNMASRASFEQNVGDLCWNLWNFCIHSWIDL